MKKHTLLSSSIALGLGLVGASASAAEWHRPADVATSAAAMNSAQIAAATLAQPELGLDGVFLEPLRSLERPDHHTLRYGQRYQGLEVIGGQVAVRVGLDGRVRRVVLAVERGLNVSTKPNLSLDQAKQVAAGASGASSDRMTGRLAIWPDGHDGRLAWMVDMPTADGGQRAVVDAHDGLVMQLRALGHQALGRVYPISSVVSPMTQDLELVDMVPSAPQYLNGWSGNLTVGNYVSGGTQSDFVLEQTVVPNSGEDFLYDPPADGSDATDEFAQVMVYFHLTRMREFFTTSVGLDMSAPSWALVAGVNLLDDGSPLDNAFFSPEGISGTFSAPNLIGIGQGSTVDFAQDSDVFNHEFTHYVTENAVGYNASQLHGDEFGLSPHSGSIDEGLSDYFSCTLNDDPILGEASLALLSSARDLTDTSKSCPNDMVGEVHADGEIIGSVAWTIREQLGAAKADALIWDAATLLTFGASFGDFYRAVRQTADDMLAAVTIDQTERDFIETALEERGLHECDPVTPLRKGEPRIASMFGLDLVGQLFGADCASVKMFVELQSLFQYEVTPDAGDDQVRVVVDMTAAGGGELDWKIYAAVNGHVQFQPGMFLPSVASWDYATESFAGDSGELAIDASSDPPFDPNASYTFVVIHQNCPFSEATLSTDAGETMTGTGGGGGAAGGAGGAGGDEGGGGNAGGDQVIDNGCGCHVAGDRSGLRWPAWIALGLAGMAVARRRRHS
jgi:MYXO-CTERM domain-containing protein